MPWKDRTVEDLRKEFVEAAEDCENFSKLCREYNITRNTGYKWKDRYSKEEPLADRSRRPNVIANKIAEPIEMRIVETRMQHPGWGAKKNKGIPRKKRSGNALLENNQ